MTYNYMLAAAYWLVQAKDVSEGRKKTTCVELRHTLSSNSVTPYIKVYN